MTTRCKFQCVSVTKQKHWDANKGEFLFTAKFTAVTSGSEENKKFFEYTPSGTIEIGLFNGDLFTPGKQYFIDISESEV